MKVKIAKDRVVETDDLTLEELYNINDLMLMNIDNMKITIEQSKVKARLEGVYADPEWFSNLKKAYMINIRQQQRLQRAIAQRKKDIAAERKRQQRPEEISFERTFMALAKEELPQVTYSMIIEKTQKRMEQQND